MGLAKAAKACQQRSTCCSIVSTCQGNRASNSRARRSWRLKAVPLLSWGLLRSSAPLNVVASGAGGGGATTASQSGNPILPPPLAAPGQPLARMEGHQGMVAASSIG